MDFISVEDFNQNVAIIKINRSYKAGMSEKELYEVTRGKWKRNLESVNDTTLVLAVCKSVVVQVYRVFEWKKSVIKDGEVRYKYHSKNRVEFVGEVADKATQIKYIGKSVAHLYKYGEANPVKVFRLDDFNNG